MSKSTMFFAAAAAFLAGAAVGFILSPVKGGVEFHDCTIGSNNSTSGRWFSPKIAGIDSSKNRTFKGGPKKKDKLIPASAEEVKADGAAEKTEKTGKE